MLYGLFNKWDQQQLSFHLAMTLTVLIMMGVVYMRFILPDKVIVKASGKQVHSKTPERLARLQNLR